MPPTSNMRTKPPPTAIPPAGSATTTTVSHINDFGASTSARRTASGRAVRAHATRPRNYYARPPTHLNINNAEEEEEGPPGFYPALQFFTDAVAALPREMARQFTVMHEAQAKICGLEGRLGGIVEGLLGEDVPVATGGVNGGGGTGGLVSLGRGMLSFGAGNGSLGGSTAASVVNGGVPGHSNAASVVGEEEGGEMDLERRQRYHEMGMVLKEMLPNMEEKNNGLLEVTRRLNLQLSRIDSVLPYLDEELSEEARYGSMTHWAYSDNRQKKQAPQTGASRRDVAGTNNLAAAANAVHEGDIAQARRDATGREPKEKQKGRVRDVVESDFDDKPKKTHAKHAKSKAMAQPGPPSGLGITSGGEPAKRRKVDKGLLPPAMERSASGAGKGTKGKEAGSRSTPNAEPSKKSTKAKPAPAPLKRKGLNSAHASPALASSPLHSSFTSAMEPPVGGRPQIGRLRQNSTTNLRHERVAAESSAKRPDSSSGRPANSDRAGSKRKARAADEDVAASGGPDDARKTIETGEGQAARREGDDEGKAGQQVSRSDSNSGKAGRGSKTGTPRNETIGSDAPAAMKRTRSTRSMRGNQDESSSEPHQVARSSKHKRMASNSHLVKQLAPYNRSPDLDRNRSSDEDEDGEGMEGVERQGGGGEEKEGGVGQWRKSPRKRRTGSRRNTMSEMRRDGDEEEDGGEAGEGDRMPQAQSPLQMNESGRDQLSPSPGAASQDDNDGLPALSPADSPTPPPVSPTPPPARSPMHHHQQQPTATSQQQNQQRHLSTPAHSPISDAAANENDEEDDEEEEEEQDPDSPSATRYCYCDRGSYGEMIACDNPQCPREWFHLGCTELMETPGEKEKWFCRDCRPVMVAREGKRGRGVGGGGRGARGR